MDGHAIVPAVIPPENSGGPVDVARLQAEMTSAITDISFDYYGKRLAVCDVVGSIRVFNYDPLTGEWKASQGELQDAHRGAVWRLDWADPSFGQVFASCGQDKKVILWYETEYVTEGGKEVVSKWQPSYAIGDCKDAVRDVKFGPKHLDVITIAIACEDGYVRIYTIADLMNVGDYVLEAKFQVATGPQGALAMSWSDSRLDPPMLVAGGDDREISVWVRHDETSTWNKTFVLLGHTDLVNDVSWAPQMGRSKHWVAGGSRDGTVRLWQFAASDQEGPDLLEGDGLDGELGLAPVATSHAVATGAGDGGESKAAGDGTGGAAAAGSTVKSLQTVQPTAVLGDHASEVWRVRWGVTGSVLVSSAEDGVARLWRQSLAGEWQCVSEVEVAGAGEGGIEADAGAPGDVGGGLGPGSGSGGAGGEAASAATPWGRGGGAPAGRSGDENPMGKGSSGMDGGGGAAWGGSGAAPSAASSAAGAGRFGAGDMFGETSFVDYYYYMY